MGQRARGSKRAGAPAWGPRGVAPARPGPLPGGEGSGGGGVKAVAARAPPARLLPCPGPVAQHSPRPVPPPALCGRSVQPARAARPVQPAPSAPGAAARRTCVRSGAFRAPARGLFVLTRRVRRDSATGVPASGSDGPTPAAQNPICTCVCPPGSSGTLGLGRGLCKTPTPQKVLARGACPGLKESNSVLDGNLTK